MKISFKPHLHNCNKHLLSAPILSSPRTFTIESIERINTGMCIFCSVCGRVKYRWEYDELKISDYKPVGVVNAEDMFAWKRK